MKHLILFLLAITTSAMAAPVDQGPLFPTLTDAAGLSSAPTKSLSGDASAGKVGQTTFSFQDSSSNLVLPKLEATTNREQASVWVRDINGVGITSDFGASSTGLRVASLLGNSTGAVDYNYGNAGAQTIRVVSIPQDGTKTTYSASINGLTVATTPTDVFTITGSGTKTVRIVRILFDATQNTAAVRTVLLIKRSSADTGGTSATVTAVPHDSSDAAATASVKSYTVNPTSLGTAVGTIRSVNVDVPAVNLNAGASDKIEWVFGTAPEKSVVLRGTSENLAINLNSVTSAGNNWNFTVEWTEE